ncbi:putative MFS family arabinose efflux permease [Amycolatopsis thermoflava]|uniref:Putative MFS family arabinose efflux permease n=2 Tax=Amycolatopsis thermoflava TaxID=84480 RepID=A0A3N2GV69_9PSEU|nr:putative MFS family arabinose efflux permease [Amycolatopsis thermoflava]
MNLRGGSVVIMTGELVRARRAVSVVFAACGAAFGTWLARVPAVQDRLGLTTGQLAAGLFGLAAGSVVALLLAGAVITRIGSRAAAVVGAVVLCGGLPLVAVAPGAAAFVAARVVLGVGNSTLDVAMNAHAARVEDGYGRPIFAGFHAFWSIGGLAGSGADALAEAWHVPVAVHFPVAGGVLLVVAPAAVLGGFLRGRDRGQGGPAFAWPGRALVPLGAIALCGFVAEGAVNSWGAVYLSEVTAAGPAVASLGYFAFSVTMIVVRLGTDRVVGRIGAVVFLRLASVVAVGGFAVVLVAPAPVLGVLGFAVVGAGVAGIVPVAWSAAGRAEPAAPGRAVAAVAACGYAGFLVEPVVIGAIATWSGLRWGLVSAVVVTGVVAVLARGVR